MYVARANQELLRVEHYGFSLVKKVNPPDSTILSFLIEGLFVVSGELNSKALAFYDCEGFAVIGYSLLRKMR